MRYYSLLLSILFPFQPTQAAFPDVPESSPFYDAVNYAQEKNIVKGYPDGTYRPGDTVNRAEFTKIILEAVNIDESTCKISLLSDVPVGTWFAPYVCKANLLGIIKGYPDGTFRPANPINFAEAAKIVALTFGAETKTEDPWFKPYVTHLETLAAVPNTIPSFEHPVTRGELAEMVFRIKTDNRTKATTNFYVAAAETAAEGRLEEEEEEAQETESVVATKVPTKPKATPEEAPAATTPPRQKSYEEQELPSYSNTAPPTNTSGESDSDSNGYDDVDEEVIIDDADFAPTIDLSAPVEDQIEEVIIEEEVEVFNPQLVRSGYFADGDAEHEGSGVITMTSQEDGSYALRIEDLFVTSGPGLRLALAKHPAPGNMQEVSQGTFDISYLKGNTGDQNYVIPSAVNLDAFKSLIIYSETQQAVAAYAILY